MTRNRRAFAHAGRLLETGELLSLFPEGISHDRPALQPLRTGAARIALAGADQGVNGIATIAVALVYDDKQRFRSKALVKVGRPETRRRLAGPVPGRRASGRARPDRGAERPAAGGRSRLSLVVRGGAAVIRGRGHGPYGHGSPERCGPGAAGGDRLGAGRGGGGRWLRHSHRAGAGGGGRLPEPARTVGPGRRPGGGRLRLRTAASAIRRGVGQGAGDAPVCRPRGGRPHRALSGGQGAGPRPVERRDAVDREADRLLLPVRGGLCEHRDRHRGGLRPVVGPARRGSGPGVRLRRRPGGRADPPDRRGRGGLPRRPPERSRAGRRGRGPGGGRSRHHGCPPGSGRPAAPHPDPPVPCRQVLDGTALGWHHRNSMYVHATPELLLT